MLPDSILKHVMDSSGISVGCKPFPIQPLLKSVSKVILGCLHTHVKFVRSICQVLNSIAKCMFLFSFMQLLVWKMCKKHSLEKCALRMFFIIISVAVRHPISIFYSELYLFAFLFLLCLWMLIIWLWKRIIRNNLHCDIVFWA